VSLRFSRYNTWVEEDGTPPAVFNGMTGRLILLEPGEAEGLRRLVGSGDVSGVDPERATMFVRSHVLVSESVDELDTLNARYLKTAFSGAHLGLTLVTSLGCNFDCPYCYESKQPSIMSAAVRDGVIRMIDDGAERLSGVDVTWMGGEPLVGRDSLFSLSQEMIERCDRHGIDYSSMIVTNGWYLDGDTARRLAENRVDLAQVTLDGPPDVHDAMRPYVGGGPTFDRIVENLHEAVDHLSVSIRVNIDESNLWRAEELMAILAEEDLAPRLGIHCAKMTYYEDNDEAPVASYTNRCYTSPEFAQVQLDFEALALRYGFASVPLPEPVSVPCMAVAGNSIVVGSDGEVWKCWDDIGNAEKVVGHVSDYLALDEAAVLPWLQFNPTQDPMCRQCIALPNCMGGCLHHTLAGHPREAQCGSFRYNHREKIRRAVRTDAGLDDSGVELPAVAASRAAAGPPQPAHVTGWQPVEIRTAAAAR